MAASPAQPRPRAYHPIGIDTLQYRAYPSPAADAPPIGVLLVNLGTPAAPDRASVRRYLAEFLSDPRVVELWRPAWLALLYGIILNTRPAKSARAYASVWDEDGSPLLAVSRRQAAALSAELAADGVRVVLAMRYGRPAIREGIEQLLGAGVTRLLVLPLYPQYSATTTASVFDAVAAELSRTRRIPELRLVNEYHLDEAYLAALAASVRRYQAEHGQPDCLLMSFHGIPAEYAEAGDPYGEQCRATARALATRLGLADDDYRLSFQSRLGPKQWLSPYTDDTVRALAADGVRHLQVVCPGFSADCLETLEEVAVENREYFLAAGGQCYQYIPCLNDQADHVAMMRQLVARHSLGWPGAPAVAR